VIGPYTASVSIALDDAPRAFLNGGDVWVIGCQSAVQAYGVLGQNVPRVQAQVVFITNKERTKILWQSPRVKLKCYEG
jgi:hypothetical protein